jgi:hypothetical protein
MNWVSVVSVAQLKRFTIAFRIVFFTEKAAGRISSVEMGTNDPIELLENVRDCILANRDWGWGFSSVGQTTQRLANEIMYESLIEMVGQENAALQEEGRWEGFFCPPTMDDDFFFSEVCRFSDVIGISCKFNREFV